MASALDLHSRDTSLEALRVQMEIYRRMGPEARLACGLKMSEDARALLADGVRLRNPGASEEQVRLATMRLWLGADLFDATFAAQGVAT